MFLTVKNQAINKPRSQTLWVPHPCFLALTSLMHDSGFLLQASVTIISLKVFPGLPKHGQDGD